MNPAQSAAARDDPAPPRRNQPCPCGSGLRYKECHGRIDAGPAADPGAGDPPQPDGADEPAPAAGEVEQRLRELTSQAAAHFNAGEPDQAEPLLAGILDQAPAYIPALRMAVLARRAAGDLVTIDRLFDRAIAARPAEDVFMEHAEYLESAQRPAEAEQQVTRAHLADPRSYRANLALGRFKQRRGQHALAEHHFRLARFSQPHLPQAAVHLGDSLAELARRDEAEHYYRVALALDPRNVGALLGWARLEESQRDLERAAELLERAREVQPDAPMIGLTESVIDRRNGRFADALGALDRLEPGELEPSVRALYFFERGTVMDRLGRYDDAFAAFDEANRINREEIGLRYAEARNSALTRRLSIVYDREAVPFLGRAERLNEMEERPIFIVGFTRSGTSLMEQILSSHHAICGGGELHYLGETIARSQVLTGGAPYPDCLTGAADGVLQKLRNEFLTRSRIAGILEPGARRFTDKTPGNELHMGLLWQMFPEAQFIHMVRHPLDSVLASYFIDCRHGDVYSSSLETTARHWVRCMEMTEHYLDVLEPSYHRVHYEKLVRGLKTRTREVLKFLGEPFDENCVRYYETERYARTPSYAQVRQKPYTGSINRYRHYHKRIESVIPILEPWIEKLGYEI